MACKDPAFHHWHLVAPGASYSLSATGPEGFTAYASFDEAGPPGMVLWNDIRPGPHVEPLSAVGTHIVRIYVAIMSAAPITVRVTAKVTPAGSTTSADFCREFTGANGATDWITHSITMKYATS